MRGSRTISGAAFAITLCAGTATAQNAPPTFSKDVAPIFMKDCVSCHREGEMAPMALTTYADARPWARAIKRKVASREMPPWFADPAHGTFRNDRALSQKEIDTIVAWVDANAPQGNPADMPPPPPRADGWNHPSGRPPDVIVEMPIEFEIPAEGQTESNGEETTFYVPVPFTEDKFIEASEVRPGNRTAVHHAIVQRAGHSAGTADQRAGQSRGQDHRRADRGRPPRRHRRTSAPSARSARRKTSFARAAAPGSAPGPPGGSSSSIAKASASGSRPARAIMFGMHYQATGKPEKDRTKIGLWFQKGPMRNELLTERVGLTHVVENTLMIEDVTEDAGPQHSALRRELEDHRHHARPRGHDGLQPRPAHAPARQGHEVRRRLSGRHRARRCSACRSSTSTGSCSTSSRSRRRCRRAARSSTVGHFDNSTKNKYNPAPEKPVYWSEQSWDEMFNGFMQYTLDSQEKPAGSIEQR